MTQRRDDQARAASETLWTAVAATVLGSANVLRALQHLSPAQLDELRKRVADDAKRDLPDLLRPFQTEVSRETVSRTFG